MGGKRRQNPSVDTDLSCSFFYGLQESDVNRSRVRPLPQSGICSADI